MPELQVYSGTTANASMADSGTGSAAPGAGAALATSLPPSGKGLYQIKVWAWLSAGTPAAADNCNLQFKFGSTGLSRIPLVPALNVLTMWETTYASDGVTNFTVNTVGAATAGVTYNVVMAATKIRDTF